MSKVGRGLWATPFVIAAILAGGWLVQSCAWRAVASSTETIGHPSFLSPHAAPIVATGDHVFVTNTPADTVDVIDAVSREIVARVDVGIDPVSLAVRPDRKELWVANHVSDSVSVIDTDVSSPTYLGVIATVQEFDQETRSTRFDEPVGIAFASNDKAYVALSSENEIAVVDVESRQVQKKLRITAQDPRAIVVRDKRLYVIPFESNNKSQLSGGYEIDGDLVTFDAHQHSVAVNNVLSLGHKTDIVKHPRVPDRDLYVFDTETDELLDVVDTLGTLLYGLAVDSKGRVFIAQADARNDANGRSGTQNHGLAELENRAFLNQITRVGFGGDTEAKRDFFDLEPLPPEHPKPEDALATPFAIQVSDDDSILVASAAGSDQVFTVDANTGDVLGRVGVDAVPRGISLASNADGAPAEAWVLNAVANTVSLLDLADPAKPTLQATIALEDPTHPAFKRGRIAFNSAAASTTGTFSCASCHPDGHTDQLLWVLETPIVTGGDQIMPRSTMPIRGLRDTEPYHWDGIPGDPYGGINAASIYEDVEPNSDIDVPESSTRFLIDAGLATTMKTVGDPTLNDEGKAGLLSGAERDDLAKFLLHVTYPPAQRRPYTNEITARAAQGFELFHITGDVHGTPGGNFCGDCHRMPFWVSTNTPTLGMDVPTWRGAYDRFLILPQGRLNIIDFPFYSQFADIGTPERRIWQFSWSGRESFDPVWDMVLEGSTGHSGTFARQVTLSSETQGDELTADLLDALELSASEGAVVLHGTGTLLDDGESTSVSLVFDAELNGGSYVDTEGALPALSRAELETRAADGRFVGTFTARHGIHDDYDHPQPALWTLGPIHEQVGRQQFPVVFGEDRTLRLNGRHVREGASVIVNGRRVPGAVSFGDDETIAIELETLPEAGLHFVQLQNPEGLFSNDFIFHVAASAEELTERLFEIDIDPLTDALESAIAAADRAEIESLIESGAPINGRETDGGTPLATAAFYGNLDVVSLLLEKGASVSALSRDGNTPLHEAAFWGHFDVAELLLEKGASVETKNERRQTPIERVSFPWSDQLAGVYAYRSKAAGLDLDVGGMQKRRLEMAEWLQEHSTSVGP